MHARAACCARSALESHTVLLGDGLLDDRIHAADESLDLPTFARGVRTSTHLLDGLAGQGCEKYGTALTGASSIQMAAP